MESRKLHVSAGTGYDVLVGSGLLSQAGALITDTCNTQRIALVTDDIVADLHLRTVQAALQDAGMQTVTHIIPHGEKNKTIGTLTDILEFLADQHCTRSDVIVALGGGVVGDIAGFAAATFLRGVRFVQIPTTLLADVDSSIGGKTAVNLPAGKNLVGAFHQPSLVICDIDCLDTLPRETLTAGMAEALKCAVLCDESLFDLITADRQEDRAEIIARCIDIKRRFVEADETEQGPRRYLNLGHTLGHAVESCSGFRIPHGSAVAIGMAMMARACEVAGDAEPGTCARIENACLSLGLPISSSYLPSQLAEAAAADKKRSGDAITFVGIASIGECYLETTPINDIERIASLGTARTAVA